MLGNRSTTVVGYIEKRLKKEMEQLAKMDRHLSISRMVDEALREYVPKKKREMMIHETEQPTEDERGFIRHHPIGQLEMATHAC